MTKNSYEEIMERFRNSVNILTPELQKMEKAFENATREIAAQFVANSLEQYRFPKSKKKRIQKKWRKNPNNWRLKQW